jgi:DNA-binding response OmpR family regulator
MGRILVIDDDAAVRLFMEKALSDHHTVFTASDWSQAMPLAVSEKLDLALVDLNLRGFQGTDVVRFLRHNFLGKIYLFSSAISKESAVDIVASCEADGFVRKELSTAVIQLEVERILRESREEKNNEGALEKPRRNSTRSLRNLLGHSARLSIAADEANSMLVKTLVENCADMTCDQFLAAHPQFALLQMNQYEALEFGKFDITQSDQSVVPAPIVRPQDSVVFFLHGRTNERNDNMITVGRSWDSDIVLRSERVSKFQAYFKRDSNGRWTLRDSRSKNGTFLNGRRVGAVEAVEVKPGSVIAFSEIIKFKFLPPKELHLRLKIYRNLV